MGLYKQTPDRLPEKLYRIRKTLDITQKEMLQRLGFEDELTQGHISAYERQKNNRVPPPGVLLRYAKIANIPLENILDDDQDLPRSFYKDTNKTD